MAEFSSEEFFAGVQTFLKEGGDDDALLVLHICAWEVSDHAEMVDTRWGVGSHHNVSITLTCPRLVYDILDDENHPITQAIESALEANLPSPETSYHVDLRVVRARLTPEDARYLRLLRDQPDVVDQHKLGELPLPNATSADSIFLPGPDIFIVYGHDDAARFQLAHYLEVDLSIHAIMLDQHQPRSSTTIIEELERQAKTAGYAVVLLTPDDVGAAHGSPEMVPRARQNVIYEAGYFHGLLGRERVLIMKEGSVEVPSDLSGILYVQMDEAGGWKPRLREKLKHLGMLNRELA